MNIPKHRLKLPPEAEHLHAKPPRKLSKRRIRKQREQEGQCRPRLAAFTGLLMGHFRQSTRLASSFLSDLLHIPSSPAWTVKIQNLIFDALSEPYCQLQTELAEQRQLYVEESPTKKQHNAKAWMWVAIAPMFAVFGIFANSSRESLVALIGDYSKIILNCDRAKM
jgi:hypothetical protein